jgi:hypothetical protein
MASFSWLHLTDLHLGMTGQRYLWPAVKAAFFDDLPRLHAQSGPWDAVIFTGDLTQRGTTKEFNALRKELTEVWSKLAALGSTPALITVPGNHDLVRPDAARPEVEALRRWHDDRAVRERVMGAKPSVERKVVTAAFAAYTRFRNAWPLPREITLKRGRIPGDFSVSIEKQGLRVALVGLNSAFLHLWGGDLTGKLALENEQLFDVATDDPPAWLLGHHAALLLTHHPPEWLHPSALSNFNANILGRDHFLAHLYGHMHEPRVSRERLGGSPERRRVQGSSLFGLEHFGEAKQERLHGYMAGRVAIDGTQGKFSVWPRRLKTMPNGSYKLVPEEELDLEDEAVVTDFKARQVAAEAKARDTPVVPPPGPTASPSRYEATRALASLARERFDAVLAALSLDAAVAGAGTAVVRADRVVCHLADRDGLDALVRLL